MKAYEKPTAEVIDFTAESILSDGGGVDDGFSHEEGNEPLAL